MANGPWCGTSPAENIRSARSTTTPSCGCITTCCARAYGLRPDDRVLDIGCGTGQTTRDAAHLAVAGSALGVDLSARMIERARELSEREGFHNVGLCQHRPRLRPAARLVMMVWQGHDRNEWSVSIQWSLAGGDEVPALPPGTPDPFSLGDPATAEKIIDTAGFADVTFTDVHEPVCYGRNVAAAIDWVRGFSCSNDMLDRLDTTSTERALERLRETLTAHHSGRGVWFDSCAWIVTARRI
jgi:hypothetical protein